MRSSLFAGVICIATVALLGVLAASSALAADKPNELDSAAEVDRLFAKWNSLDSPGCAVGIVRDGRVIYAKGFGSANLEGNDRNSPQTIFEIGSASKSFTCACIALLLDQGRIKLDDDLRRFVPEMHPFEPPILVRHLIQCRSGLWEPFHIMPLAGWDNLPVHSPYSEADLLTVLSGQQRLPFEPGTQFHYGSGDYYFLGLIVKRVTGKPLADFARENLFEPLGMTRTFYEQDPTLPVKGRAVGHYRQDGGWHQWRVNSYLAGPGGVKSCIDDLVRWDRNFDDNRLAKGKHLDEFIREGTLLGNRYVLDADAYRKHVQQNVANAPMGRYRGLRRIQFTGGVWGMTAATSRFPEQRFTVICLSNNDELSPFTKTREISELYLADVMEPLPTPTPDEPTSAVELRSDELRDKIGAYRLVDEGRIWKVAVMDGDLHTIDPTSKAWRLKPLSATRFRPAAGSPFYESARFIFHRDAPDRTYSMTLESNEHGFREVIPFRRVELVEPPVEKLADYAGEFLNDEVLSTYRFEVKDGALWLRVASRRWERLDPTVSDEFIPNVRTLHDNRIITFRRDTQSRVVGFSIAFWRVKGLDFQRR